MIKIEDVKLEETAEHKELSALVDGSRVWFRFPKWASIGLRAEIFLPVAIAEAMVRAEDIVVEDQRAISAKLLAALPEVVNVFCSWNPDDNHKIQVHATSEATAHPSESVICCFSGGIDSSLSFSQHQAEITDLLVVMGFDLADAGAQWQQLTARIQKFANKHGKRVITVETNIRKVIESRNLSWEASYGCVLASIGIALAPRTFIIPSGYSYPDLFAYGSHPLLDPLWSTESTTVLHDGLGFSRTQKTECLVAHQALLDDLQVCWDHINKNCGRCSKCVRTSLALHLLGATSVSLPAYPGTESLSILKPGSLAGVPFTEDLIRLAKRTGHLEVARILIRYRDRFLFKYHLIESVRTLLGSRGRRLSHRLAKKGWHALRTKIKSGLVTLD